MLSNPCSYGIFLGLPCPESLAAVTSTTVDSLDTGKRKTYHCFVSTSELINVFCSNSGEEPVTIELNPPPFTDGSRLQLPIAIMASNRPYYLLRMLRGLQKVEGLDPSTMTVFIDGFWDEPAAVTRLMGLKLQQHAGVSQRNARVAQVTRSYVASTLCLTSKSSSSSLESLDLLMSGWSFAL